MNKHVRNLIIVIPASFLAAYLAVLLFLLDPTFKAEDYIIISMLICTVWAFFIVPAAPYSVRWVKNFFNNLSLEQSFRLGVHLGYGWGVLIFIMLHVAAPVTGTIWYIDTFKAIKSERAAKKREKDDVFDL